MTIGQEEDRRREISSHACTIVGGSLADVAVLVGDVVEYWVAHNLAPRVCVGDITEAIVEAVASALGSEASQGKAEFPGVTFTSQIDIKNGGKRVHVVASIKGHGIANVMLGIGLGHEADQCAVGPAGSKTQGGVI